MGNCDKRMKHAESYKFNYKVKINVRSDILGRSQLRAVTESTIRWVRWRTPTVETANVRNRVFITAHVILH